MSPPTRRNATDGDRSDPAVTTAASSQPDTASAGHRPAAAAPAAATATTASPRPLPAGSSGTGSTARMPASRVKNPRTRPAEERNRRSLSRTVSCGTPLAAAIDRNPWPRAARASMSPITAVPSHRRASTHAGSSTCVTPHEPHRARRGRTLTGTRPAVKTRRETAWPHPPSRPPQPGHESPPLRRRSSATAVLLPTVSNGASKHLTALPGLREKATGRADPKPTRSRCRRTPPRRNQNHHEKHAHQQRRNHANDAHAEWRLTPGPPNGSATSASCAAPSPRWKRSPARPLSYCSPKLPNRRKHRETSPPSTGTAPQNPPIPAGQRVLSLTHRVLAGQR